MSTLIANNLPSGYFRDLQIIKESFLPSFDELKSCLFMADMVMSQLEVNRNILGDDRYKYLFSVEEVNKLVLQGIPFRDAYKQIAETIQNGSFNPVMNTAHTHEGSLGNLCNDKIAMRMDQVMNDFDFQKIDEAVNALLENGKK